MTPKRSGDAAKSLLYLLLMQDKRWWNQNSPHPALTSAFQRVLHSLPLSVIQCFHFLSPSALLSFLLAQRGLCYTLKASLCVCVCECVCWLETLLDQQIRVTRWKNKVSTETRRVRADCCRGPEAARVVCVAVCQWHPFLTADLDNLSDAVSFIKSSERDNEERIKLKQLLHGDTDGSLGGSCGCISQFSGPRFDWAHCICCPSVSLSLNGFQRLERSRKMT